MVNVMFTPNGQHNSKAANTVEIISPNVVKQGDSKNDFLVKLIKDGVPLDLTGKTVTWSAASNKGKFVTDRPATVEGEGTVGIEFTGDDVGATGSLRVEFKVTYADGDVEKFPAQNYAYFEITRSLDDLGHTPVLYASVQFFEDKVAEVKAGQQTFEQTVDGKIVELESTVQQGIGAFTEDTEVVLARGGEVNLGARLDKTTAQLADKGKNIRKTKQQIFGGIEAHRGAQAFAPENTMKAITKAGELGYALVEIDPCKTSDGHWVLMHDTTVDRTTDGTGAVSTMTLAQIQALKIDTPATLIDAEEIIRVPLLEDALKECSSWGMGVNIDGSKFAFTQLVVEELANLLNKYNLTSRSYIVCPTKTDRELVNQYAPQLKIGWTSDIPKVDEDIIEAANYDYNVLIAYPAATITDTVIEKCNKAGIDVMPYISNIVDGVYAFINKGVKHVETDSILPGSVL